MQARLYIDEDAMARAFISGLRARGVDVTTVLDAGMEGLEDAVQLDVASREGRVLYTFNVGHFCQLHDEFLAEGKSHSGIIVANRQRYSVGEQIRRILNLINVKSAEDFSNSLEFL